MIESPTTSRPIKWTYATGALPDRPSHWHPSHPLFRLEGAPPTMGEVLVSEVVRIGHHSRIDSVTGTKLGLFEGDLIAAVFSPRYATRQYEAVVPDSLEGVQLVAGGGVCGRVVGRADSMAEPTMLKPLGYLVDAAGKRVNLASHGLSRLSIDTSRIPVILSVGASMDAGKTTSACYLINGLSRAGMRVGAAKLTGTAASKDPQFMRDAGAVRVVDFSNVGYASTLGIAQSELERIATVCMTQLADARADVFVLEIADGVVQRETKMLLSWFAHRAGPTFAMFACGDALAVRTGLERLRQLGLRTLAVTGVVTASPLSTLEASCETDLPVLRKEQLRDPGICNLLGIILPDSSLQPSVHVRARMGSPVSSLEDGA